MALSPGFLDLARALVRADTVSANGNLAAVELLQPLYEEAGLTVQRQDVRASIDGAPEVAHANLLAGPGGNAATSEGAVLLVTHLDTVPSGPRERWTQTGGDPWALTEHDSVLYGLGCADVKLDALCKAEAARRVRGRRFARPFWLLGTWGEEVGLRGARHFAESPLFAQVRPRWVLCGEPSELKLVSAHKGYAVVRCTVTDAKARLVTALQAEELTFSGKAAHSSTPRLGVNAILRAIAWSGTSGAPVLSVRGGAAANVVPASCTVAALSEAGQRGDPAPDGMRRFAPEGSVPNQWRALATAGALGELWLQLVSSLTPRDDPRFDPPGAVGGLNVVDSSFTLPDSPDALYGTASVTATLDARLLPGHDPDALLAAFTARAQEWVQRLGGGELSLRVSVERNAGGMSLAPDAPLLRAVSTVLTARGLDGAAYAKPTSTEAGVFARAGCEAIVLGPGRSTGNAHTANEHIELAQLAQAVDLYEALLAALCGG